MGVDYIVDAPCIDRSNFDLADIAARLKERAQATEVLRWYRDNGDNRPLSEIGFEVTRRAADGSEATELVLVQDAFERAKVLDDVARTYADCDELGFADFFGCFGSVNYPIANKAEIWMLEQLPGVESPVLFLMLMRGVQEFGYTGNAARELRNQVGVYFQNPDTLARRYAEMDVTTDVLFEMIFQLGDIQPAHGAMLLLFLNAIPRDSAEPSTIMALTRGEMNAAEIMQQFPFQAEIQPDDEPSVKDIKRFLRALYYGILLGVPLRLDI